MADIRKDLFGLEFSVEFGIVGIEEADINIILKSADEMSSTIYGNVTDTDGTPISDATVKVFDNNGIPHKHTLTDAEGNYTIESLPVGSYSVGVAKKNYLMTNTVGVSLSEGEIVALDFKMIIEPTLSLGAIAGVITYTSVTGAKVELAGAKLSLLNSIGETLAATYSAVDGEFAFYDLDDGIYTIIATSEGYITSSPMTVTITHGSISNIDMSLIIDTRTFNGTVSGIIKDYSGSIVDGCFVGLYKVVTDGIGIKKEKLIATTKTNASGLYLFGRVVDGSYMVKAKMNK